MRQAEGGGLTLARLAPLAFAAAALLAVEVGLELRARSRGWDTLLLGRAAAGGGASGEDMRQSADFPFRSARVAEERAPGVARVWFASASYGQDEALPAAKVFPNRAEAHLRAAGIACEVLNASHAGDTILGNRVLLRDRGGRYRPDAVVLYEMSNDLDQIAVEVLSGGHRGAHERSARAQSPIPEQPSDGPALGWAGRLFERSTTFANLKTVITARLTKARILCDRLPDEAEVRFEARVRLFLAEARLVGARPILSSFATAYRRDELERVPPERELGLLRTNVYLSLAGWLDAIERMNGVLQRIAGEEGLPFVDVAAEVGGRPELFRDLWHFTAEGHDRVGALFARALGGALRP